MKQGSRIFVLPHFKNRGGAGRYVSAMISSLSKQHSVQLIGAYASEFGSTHSSSNLGGLILPFYDGISLRVTMAYFFRALLILPTQLVRAYRFAKLTQAGDVLILTSSIQILYLPIFKIFRPSLRVILLVQETVPIDGFLGKAFRHFSRYAYSIIGVSDSWVSAIQSVGTSAMLIANPISNEPFDLFEAGSTDRYDLIYVGGDSKLKGFLFFLEFLDQISNDNYDVALLGAYSNAALERIRSVGEANPNLNLHVIGYTNKPQLYMSRSRIAIFPLRNYHFCRPALEAGLLSKTYIIPDFPEIGDFSIPDETCFVYKRGNMDSLLKVLNGLNESEVSQRGESNRQFAEKFSLPIFSSAWSSAVS